jgi:hypothetical protein
VTHVGLHERSAREKISHVMNSSSQAHIMNDEATRKYFQVRASVCVCVCDINGTPHMTAHWSGGPRPGPACIM